MKCIFVLSFYNALSEDFCMCYYVRFLQIGSHMIEEELREQTKGLTIVMPR